LQILKKHLNGLIIVLSKTGQDQLNTKKQACFSLNQIEYTAQRLVASNTSSTTLLRQNVEEEVCTAYKELSYNQGLASRWGLVNLAKGHTKLWRQTITQSCDQMHTGRG
jgi:hypothetical protein